MENGVFKTLYGLDVSAKTEKKDGLTYLSWPYAWAEAKKAFPGITYEIWRDPETRLPYVFDANTGYMVSTSVTLGGITHEMWLPVMDAANHAMKAEPYEIQTKYKTITVKPATMFDINKTIMRCLVKNLAMFGLGLYIYAGEDLPEDESYDEPKRTKASKPKDEPVLTKEHKDALILLATEKYGDDAPVKFVEITGVRNLGAIPDAAFEKLKKLLEEAET